jgi:predicted nucleic acid-binding protein
MIIDTNVILHLLDGRHAQSLTVIEAFYEISAKQRCTANEIVFAEISASFRDAEAVADQFEAFRIDIERLTFNECFRAGLAFREYRKKGGPRTAILPDFLIGAQASLRGWPILTCDTKRFSTYFPEVELIDPLQAQT